MFTVCSDGSIEDQDGRVVYFSFDRFVSDIVEGNNCFICGVSPSKVKFNNEHVLPDWILKRHSLYDRFIIIPNQTEFRYSQFKIPCCEKCNSLLGKTLEEPMRNMFTKGYDSFSQEFKQRGPKLFFTWMALIFLKTHLKDRRLRFHKDLRKGDVKISALYTWEELHHIHCICRAFFTQCHLDANVYGSIVALPAKTRAHIEGFDFGDLHLAQTMLLRIDDIAVLVVLNDSCASLNVIAHKLQKISAPLSPLQLRELAVRLAFVNLNLKKRPRFHSELDMENERYRITCTAPSVVALRKTNDSDFGALMYFYCKGFLSASSTDPSIVDHVKSGKWTFLFDSNEQFIADSMELVPQDLPIPTTEGST
jgi:hypothetical protein